ncbi:outer membrane beta-barrel protein [Lysobacter sp. FW306-1B-D06B]|uniref:outer membrane beta-barrel protein n=1 Tax=Lysobacter sp. FW306-1B-D06B TaxID=3140250 RepID=UPI003140602F
MFAILRKGRNPPIPSDPDGALREMHTMRKALTALVLALAAPLAANASDSNGIGYTNVQLDYIYEYDFMDGVGISGSYELTDNFFLAGSYAYTTDSEDVVGYAADTTHKSYTLGVGFNTPIGDRADWVSQLAFARHDVSGHDVSCYVAEPQNCRAERWSAHAKGYNLSTGVRGRITDKLTANAYAGYEDYSGYEGNWYADLNVGYNFTKTWSAEAGVRLNEDAPTWRLGVRASF